MNKTVFMKRLEEIRAGIFQGNLSEGMTLLSGWLPDLEDDDERLEVLLDMILLSLSGNDFEDAKQNWEKIQELSILEPPARMTAYQAYFLILDGKRRRGLSLFESCILEQPDCYEFYLLRGLAYILLDQYEYAQADFVRANTLNPNNVIVMAALGDTCAELDEGERAIALHESVLEICPDFKHSLMSLGVLYFDRNRIEEAYKLFQCLASYDPTNWFAWTCLGDILSTQSGCSFQALSYYAAAVIAGSEASSTYIGLAKGLFILGKYANGVDVLKRYERNGGHWNSGERRFVRYLMLMADIIEHPDKIEADEFISVFQSLKGISDHCTALLFQILSAACSFRNEDSTQRIYFAHATVYACFMQYIKLSENRSIQEEETVMLSVIIHQLIWNGFKYEAMSLLAMFHRVEDARLADMASLMWCELYEQSQLSQSTGICLEKLHRQFVRIPQTEYQMNLIMSGQLRALPYDSNWKQAISAIVLGESGAGISYDLMRFPWDDAILGFHQSNQSDPELIRLGWILCAHAGKSEFEKDDQALLSNLSENQKGQLLHLLSMYQDNAAARNTTAPRMYCPSLPIRFDNDLPPTIDDVFFASNDNISSVSSTEASELFSGQEPLPFAMDGTAFRRLMPKFCDDVRCLDKKGLRYLFKIQVRRALFCYLRNKTDARTDVGQMPDEAQLLSYTDSAIEIWQALNGEICVNPERIVNPKDDMYQAVMDTVFKDSETYRTIQNDIRNGLFPDVELKLPDAGNTCKYKLLYRVPKVCSYPRSAGIYAQAVSGQLLSWPDLVEQFFNYAVDLIETWISTRQDKLLTCFIHGSIVQHFRFRSFDAFCKSSKGNHTGFVTKKKFVRPLAAKYHPGTMRIHASNTDSENKPRHAEHLFVPRADNYRSEHSNIIHHVHEMGNSMARMYAYYLKRRRLLPEDTFSETCISHPFLAQFMRWAETMATMLFPKIQEIELQSISEQIKPETALWKIREILRKFPFLSRLYLIQARIYARLEDEDKLMQAIQTGCRWEERLYRGVGWKPIHPDANGCESALEPTEGQVDFEEPQPLIWREHYVLMNHDEFMAHYIEKNQRFGMRQRERKLIPGFVNRIINGDKGGGFEFYQLFKQFMQRNTALREVFISAIQAPGVYSLRDYLAHVIINLNPTRYFPLRRQFAELLFQLYPQENVGPLAKFYCDNVQISNAIPKASYAFLSEVQPNGESDDMQACATIGCLLYDLGVPEEAQKFAERSIHFKNPPVQAYLTRACSLIDNHQYEEAIDMIKLGLKLDPKQDRFYYNLALVYLDLDRPEDAEQAAKSGIAISRYPVDLQVQLLRAYVRNGKFVDALPLVRAIADVDPDLLLSTIKFPEFEVFREMLPVKTILDECAYHRPE